MIVVRVFISQLHNRAHSLHVERRFDTARLEVVPGPGPLNFGSEGFKCRLMLFYSDLVAHFVSVAFRLALVFGLFQLFFLQA